MHVSHEKHQRLFTCKDNTWYKHRGKIAINHKFHIIFLQEKTTACMLKRSERAKPHHFFQSIFFSWYFKKSLKIHRNLSKYMYIKLRLSYTYFTNTYKFIWLQVPQMKNMAQRTIAKLRFLFCFVFPVERTNLMKNQLLENLCYMLLSEHAHIRATKRKFPSFIL